MPNLSFPFCVAAATAPAQVAAGCPCSLAVALPKGGHPCGWHRRPCWRQPLASVTLQAVAALAGWPQPTVPAGGCRPRGRCFCPYEWLPPLAGAAGLPFGLALAAASRPLVGGLGRGLAMGGRPCMGAGRGWLPLLLVAFAVKMQQECVERFYTILSHHMQFKINLSHENLGSDTTVGKPL
ncbi:hypothetical protein BHM03_00047896 [Ensete ventricosum]|nr:hypothetical protein BHM03_00047896 [Ensete ventricosum]